MRILLGERLRNLRESAELTQIELAKHLNCSAKMLSNYELNKREPDLLMIKNICRFFNVSVDYLLGVTNNMRPFKNGAEYFELPQGFPHSALASLKDYAEYLAKKHKK